MKVQTRQQFPSRLSDLRASEARMAVLNTSVTPCPVSKEALQVADPGLLHGLGRGVRVLLQVGLGPHHHHRHVRGVETQLGCPIGGDTIETGVADQGEADEDLK